MISEKRVLPFGSWPSPISAEAVVRRGIDLGRALGQIQIDRTDVYWVEGRPGEGGRNVIVRFAPPAETSDALPPPFSARTRAHEYGGGDFTVHRGTVFYANDLDQRLYRRDPNRRPQPITPPGAFRYADPIFDRFRNRLICAREDYSEAGRDPGAVLLAVEASGHQRPVALASGADFYSSPRLSPDGKQLAWLSWNHPNMPWDASELWVATVTKEGTLADLRRIAGGGDESIFQPEWSPAGFLYFISDRSGWWNLYRVVGHDIHAVAPMAADFGVPQWNFGQSTFGFATEKQLVACFTRDGKWELASIATDTGEVTPIRTPYTDVANLRVTEKYAYFRAATPTSPHEIVRLDLARRVPLSLRYAELPGIGDDNFSAPEAITFDTAGDAKAHAFFYRPNNPGYQGPEGTRPPLIVISHGGPTASAATALDLKIQFWTSRGFAVVDVNYRGSSGYGRAYRRALDGLWGLADVEDCVNAARWLAAQGWVDPERMVIRGSSAGGYTCLCALTFWDVFKAGASYYGISDLEALARDTHKFEAHYTDRLVGPYPARRDLYRERSPIHFAEKLSCPVIVLQGLDDKVVPPNQAQEMVDAVRAKGLPVAYLTFEGEGHGFRQPANAKRALEAELYFYAKCFGFDLADTIEPVPIENLAT